VPRQRKAKSSGIGHRLKKDLTINVDKLNALNRTKREVLLSLLQSQDEKLKKKEKSEIPLG